VPKPIVVLKRRTVANARLAASVLLFCISTASLAAEPLPKALNKAVESGVKVVRNFPAASNLTGWVLSQGGRYSIVYTTPDKKTLLAGSLIGEDGENLAAQYEEKYVPKPDFGALFQELEKSSFVAEGTIKSPKTVIYVFFDPNCPFCHAAWRAVQPYEKIGLQVRWIAVATLGPTSLPKAIEVMAAADQIAAFRKMEENHGKPWTPSTQSAESGHPAIVAAIRQNGELMEKFGIAGTPGVVWKDKQGKVQVKGGMPRLSELPSITGLPLQKNEDSALTKFQ
jgi:thiol:disulfide interchange protein DsbG